MPLIHIGFDDTDSPKGGCTTYLCAVLVEKLSRFNVEFKDYPLLVRLNPNVPFRTRGNGCICLRLRVDEEDIEKVKSLVLEEVENFSDLSFSGTNPGVAYFVGQVPVKLRRFYEKELYDMISLEEARRVAEKCGVEVHAFKKGRGIIGALAAVGALLEDDSTYELIAYRTRENRGKPRRVDPGSVREMDRLTGHRTFNNIDGERILITPHGPDPVLYGIRGETPEDVLYAHTLVRVYEPIERWVIFRSNQGTDAHLRLKLKIAELRPYMSVIVEGKVTCNPTIIPGGHVIVKIGDETGEIDCAAYEPTKAFRWIVSKLIPGDVVRVYGGVRPPSSKHPKTVNIEKLEVIKLSPLIKWENPLCPNCGKKMTSAGRGKGFKCKRCGKRLLTGKRAVHFARNIKEGLYIPPPQAQRHLTRPYERLNTRNKPPIKLVPLWHFP